MEIIDNIPVEFSVKRVLSILHMEADVKYVKEVQELIDTVKPIIRPKAIFDVSYIEHLDKDKVEIGGIKFTSRVLRVNLDKVGRIFPYIATSGIEAEKIDVPSDDLMKRFIIDTLKEIALKIATDHLYKHIENKYKTGQMSSMNPGSLEDWPISEQKPLFSIFGNVEDLIGVKLTDSFLMIPIKSVSGIYFPTEVRFASCQLCPRERCPGRKAKYDPELKEQYK